MSDLEADLQHVEAALQRAAAIVQKHARGVVDYTIKQGHGPVTAADHEVDALLRGLLPRPGDGWLSEETVDDRSRFACRRVWIVDPLDGTRSFLAKEPEYSVSIGLVVDGEAVLGGICNPATQVTVVGGVGLGVRSSGDPGLGWGPVDPGGLRVLGSRTEVTRGEWTSWQRLGLLQLRPIGSVAYKMALVAAGFADATWTFRPKSEWDVAAGMALVRAAGGTFWSPFGDEVGLNQEKPVYRGFAAAGPGHAELARHLIAQGRART